MIRLMKSPAHRSAGCVEVFLKVALTDLHAPSDDCKEMAKAAKAAKRELGAIFREHGVNTYFTYDPQTQAQLEVSIIAALNTPTTQVHISQAESQQWSEY